MTPLAARLREKIAASGPISIEYYMQLCLGDPAHGYYMTRDPLGAGGDFTTAPEISQMFGEMIGVWLLNVWQGMGAPPQFNLVELGPGRGTLMADILRTTKIAPEFLDAAHISLVETSPVLRARQEAALKPFLGKVIWHPSVQSLPDGPVLIVANEFFDALPIRQFERSNGAWYERMVALTPGGEFRFRLRDMPELDIQLAGEQGAVLERCIAGETVMAEIARRMDRAGGAALVIDYGHPQSGFGDTLQAVRRHAFADIFAEPGEADLTAHVDFSRLAGIAQKHGARVTPPVAQGAFLRALGIDARADALARRANDSQRADIVAALQRLTGAGTDGMGELFKVMAVTHARLPAPPGF